MGFNESAWKRGRRDTVRAAKSTPGMTIEIGGSAIVGVFWQNPIVVLCFLVGSLLCIWIGATVSAPIRQRDEARLKLSEKDIYLDLVKSACSRLWMIGIGLKADLSNQHTHQDAWKNLYKWKNIALGLADYLDASYRHKIAVAAMSPDEHSSQDMLLEIISKIAGEGMIGDPVGDFEMTSLKDARKKSLEDFIKEHKADPDGDLDKLDALIKRPTQGSEKAARPTSTQGSSDD